VKQVSPTLLSASIVRFVLARDTEADLKLACELTDRMLGDREVPFRVRDNIMVMMLGLHCFEEYAAGLGIALPELDADAAVGKLLEDLLESGALKTFDTVWDVMSPANRMRLIEAVVKKVIVNEPKNEVTAMLNDLGPLERHDGPTDEPHAEHLAPAPTAMEAASP